MVKAVTLRLCLAFISASEISGDISLLFSMNFFKKKKMHNLLFLTVLILSPLIVYPAWCVREDYRVLKL